MAPVQYHEGRFPPAALDWPRLIPLLGPAAAAVARYDGMLAAVPNPAVLLSPLTTQEAVLSSRIEGTQATMEMKRRIPEMTRSQFAIRALDWIFERPIFRSSDFVDSAGIPVPTARRFLGVLLKSEILRVLAAGSGRRATVLAFPALLNIAEGREVL